jgi:transposase-like protein
MSNMHRKPRAVDWAGISDRYFKTDDSVRAIARAFGITDAAIRKHAAERGWVRPAKASTEDIGRLASSLALAMISIDGVSKRAKCFVAAMVKLDARPVDIADGLEISETALRAEFANELRS